MKFTAALIASVAATSPANWADYDAMTVWLKDHDVNNTHEDLMLEVAVAKYGEALEISAHDDNDIIIELTGLPATATLSYQDSTTGIPAGESSLAILGSTAPEDIETVRTAYLALELPEEGTYEGDFTLVISDSVTCTEANVSDCEAAKKTTITVKVGEEGFDWYKNKEEIAIGAAVCIGSAVIVYFIL